MNISQLECFLSVADHLSFAKAAEELSISQPAASHQIQSLENELGGIRASPYGEYLGDHPADGRLLQTDGAGALLPVPPEKYGGQF